jgi:signal transduction histidine kinase
MILFFFGIGLQFFSYRTAETVEEQRQLRWVFYGICVGALGFILLWQIPFIIFGKAFITEEVMLLLSVVAPISLAFAVVRYKALDIDLIIKRTTIYAVVLVVVFALYIGIVALATTVLYNTAGGSSAPSVIAALAVALVFEPLRRRTQRSIDKRFFRTEFDVLAVEREIGEQLKKFYTLADLGNYVVETVDTYLPVTRIGFFMLREPNDRLQLVAHHGFDLLARRGVAFSSTQLKTDLTHPVIRQPLAPPDAEYETADETVFARWGIVGAFPMKQENTLVSGFLVLGARRSDKRFSEDDIDFLKTVAVQSSIAIERIRLHEQLIIEQEESERLAELNRMKTYFVSSVSHDLKTPLTSISMFAELIKDRDSLPTEKRNEYLSIIQGESQRLSRLIGTVLDFAKIERGTKEYQFQVLELDALLKRVTDLLEYQFKMQGFAVSVSVPETPVAVSADPDALTDVIMNVLTNAMKYSADRKEILIALTVTETEAIIEVQDKGIGIPLEKLPRLFEAFFRVDEASSSGGAGLGLAIAKHTIDAHHGTIVVRSVLGEGSSFSIHIPLLK